MLSVLQKYFRNVHLTYYLQNVFTNQRFFNTLKLQKLVKLAQNVIYIQHGFHAAGVVLEFLVWTNALIKMF